MLSIIAKCRIRFALPFCSAYLHHVCADTVFLVVSTVKQWTKGSDDFVGEEQNPRRYATLPLTNEPLSLLLCNLWHLC